MAGKSTVLRSTAAVALLAAAGLHAPARSASIPYLDAFMLRNFSADSPLEGKSSFAVEMTEMRCASAPLMLELHADPTAGHCAPSTGGCEVAAACSLSHLQSIECGVSTCRLVPVSPTSAHQLLLFGRRCVLLRLCAVTGAGMCCDGCVLLRAQVCAGGRDSGQPGAGG